MNTATIAQHNVAELVPYEFNPRNNEGAISAVKNSIKEFGFLVPIVVDADKVIVAGHTRHAAMLELIAENPTNEEYKSVPCIVADSLTEDQLKAFRLIDNKTAEIAGWDFDLLSAEIGSLSESGIPFVEFGWTQEEMDCLHNVVATDCLTDSDILSAMDEPTATNENGRTQHLSKDGKSVRITFGELSFFVLAEDYKAWLDEMMKHNEYDPVAVIHDMAERTGLLAAKLKRDQHVSDALTAAATPTEAATAAEEDLETETIPA